MKSNSGILDEQAAKHHLPSVKGWFGGRWFIVSGASPRLLLAAGAASRTPTAGPFPVVCEGVTLYFARRSSVIPPQGSRGLRQGELVWHAGEA
jgi:hypothetical protein